MAEQPPASANRPRTAAGNDSRATVPLRRARQRVAAARPRQSQCRRSGKERRGWQHPCPRTAAPHNLAMHSPTLSGLMPRTCANGGVVSPATSPLLSVWWITTARPPLPVARGYISGVSSEESASAGQVPCSPDDPEAGRNSALVLVCARGSCRLVPYRCRRCFAAVVTVFLSCYYCIP